MGVQISAVIIATGPWFRAFYLEKTLHVGCAYTVLNIDLQQLLQRPRLVLRAHAALIKEYMYMSVENVCWKEIKRNQLHDVFQKLKII